MYRARKNRKIIIGSLLILLLMISVGYAAFQTSLTIRGTSRITSNWDVRITNVTTGVATGDAENVSTPTWTDLTAYMEANLYDKGSAMDYDVTISNRGTFDAKLDNIITTPSSNEAVIITFSGYTKGETLAKGQDKVIHVKIQYNPNYNGTAEVSGTSIVEFQYVQDEGSNIPTETRYLLTYDYGENGGTSTNAENEYLAEGTVVNLSGKAATKAGYTFVGWNTDKNAHTGLSTTTMTANTILYAIYSKNVTITFDKNGNTSQTNASGTAVTTQTVTRTCTLWNKDASCSVTAPTMVAASGFSIDGYSTGPTVYSNYWTHNTAKNVSADATWYAQSTKAGVDRTITFYRNSNTNFIHGGTTTTGTSRTITVCTTPEVHNGAAQATSCSASFTMPTITAPSATPDVIGWSDAADNRTASYTSGQVVNSLSMSSNRSLYAQSQKASVQLTASWNANGASLSSTSASNCTIAAAYNGASQDSSCTVDAPTITREGFTITGFNTTADATTNNSSYSTSTKKLTLNSSNTGSTWYAITYKTFTITYAKGTGVSSISPTSTSVSKTIRNNASSVDVPLPKINPSTNYEALGWFDGDTKVGDSEGTYAATGAVTLTAKAKLLPVLKTSGTSSSNILIGSSGIAETDVTSIVFEDNINIPNGATNWDVSAVTDSGAVMAWVTADPNDNTKYVLHVGGDGGVIANTSLTYLFDGYTNLASVTFGNNFDTTRTTGMGYMFRNCTSLTSLDLSTFDTSKVSGMTYMFSGCTGLTSITFGSGWSNSTASTNNMSYMFNNCSNLTTINNLNNLDTSNVINMSYMFQNCTSLTSLNLSTFDTSKVTTMSSMFSGDSGLTSITFGTGWSHPAASTNNMQYMFRNCTSLTSLDLSTFDTSNVTSMYYMFSDCTGLTTITFGSGWGNATAASNNMAGMFADCSALTTLNNLSSIDTSNVTAMGSNTGSGGMFSGCTSLTSLDLSTFDTSKVTSMQQMFSDCTGLTTITFGTGWNNVTAESNKMWEMFKGCSSLTTLNNLNNVDTSNVTSMYHMFYGCSSLTSLNLSTFDTGNVTSMQGMFYNCRGLISITFGTGWGHATASTNTMAHMFYYCTSLTSLNLSTFDTSNVTSMTYMFNNCTNLASITFGAGWSHSTASTNIMSFMFQQCYCLDNLDLSTLDTSNVTSMGYMFNNCTSLTNLNVSNFDTSNVTVMSYMFSNCNILTTLKLCTFDTSAATDMSYMFRTTSNMQAIFVGTGWDTSGATTTGMFSQSGVSSVTQLTNCSVAANSPVIQSWDQNAAADFHASEYKSSITSVVFENHTNVPSGATSWDVSATPNTGTVMAWVTADQNDNTKYVLHIGGKGGVIANENSARLFDGFTEITSINFNGNYNTNNATTMEGIFKGCTSLTSLDLSDFDTSNVTNMGAMFKGNTALSSINLSSFDTSSATHIGSMFANCTSLTNIDLSNFNTSNVTRLDSMFSGDSSLQILTLCNFDTSSVTNMNNMFNGTTNLQVVYVGSDWTTENATTTDMYINSGISGVTKYNNCKIAETNPVIKSWSASDTTDFHSSEYKNSITSIIFENNTNIPQNVIASWDVSAIMNTGNVMAWVVSDGNSGYVLHIGGEDGVIANENSAHIFRNFTALTSISFNNNYDTSNTTSISSMFRDCSSLTSLDLNSFNTNAVTNMGALFNGCTNLTQLDITNFDTSNVTNMSSMFSGTKLTSLDLSNFDTSKVKDMSHLFNGCSVLTNLDISNFDTNSVTTMEYMFYNCTSLTNIDLNNFNTDIVSNMNSMFRNCTSLTTIYASEDYVTTNVTDSTNMFLGDTVLVGGNGTAYDTSKIDKTYAKIDKTGQKGYFTVSTSPIITNKTTQSTTDTITLIVDAYVPNGDDIVTYEYSIDHGETWVTQANPNISPNMYTFTNLEPETNYEIRIRLTSESNNNITETVSVITKTIEAPTFSENVSGEAVITYPTGCSSPYSCSYKLDDSEEVPVTTSSVTLPLGTDGIVEAKVTDGTSTENSIYNLRKTDLYVSINGNDTTGVGTVSQPYATINKAYSSASSTTDATIYVMNNIEQASTVNMDSNKTITITSSDSNGDTGTEIINKVTRANSNLDNIINITSGNLNINNITIDGNNITNSDTMIVVDNSIISLNKKTTLQNNKTNARGGALSIKPGSILNVNGAIIKNNSGLIGGAIIGEDGTEESYSTININSGSIRGNASSGLSGGIHLGYYANFNMTAGAISNNTATTHGGGLYMGGNAVANITGGNIVYNKATNNGGGIYNNNGSLTVGGTLSLGNNTSQSLYSYNIAVTGETSEIVDLKANFIGNNSTNATYKIVSKKDNTFVVDVTGGKAVNGTNIELYKDNGSNAQKFKMLPDNIIDGVVYYHIENQVDSTQVIDNAGNSAESGNNIQTYAWGTGNGERWSLANGESNYYNIKTYTGLCMDVKSGTMANGTNIQSYTCNNSDAQFYKFISTTGQNRVSSTYNSTVGSGSAVVPNVTSAAKNTTVTFTVPNVSGFTYQGATVKSSDGKTTVATLNSSTKSFTMPDYAVVIHPTYKYNDKMILNTDGTRDTTFSMTKTHASVLSFNYNTSGSSKFYYFNAGTNTGDYRGQATSAKTYDISKYCGLYSSASGSVWSTNNNYSVTPKRYYYFGINTNIDSFSHGTTYHKEINMTLTNGYTGSGTLSIPASLTGNYYILLEYLNHKSNASLNINQVKLTGCTYTS